jgi:hypothetical protein
MTKEDLMPLAKTYFDSGSKRTVIYGTEDKHFFNTESDAMYYCKQSVKFYSFHRSDFEKKPEVKKVTEVSKVESKEEKPVKKVTIKK